MARSNPSFQDSWRPFKANGFFFHCHVEEIVSLWTLEAFIASQILHSHPERLTIKSPWKNHVPAFWDGGKYDGILKVALDQRHKHPRNSWNCAQCLSGNKTAQWVATKNYDTYGIWASFAVERAELIRTISSLYLKPYYYMGLYGVMLPWIIDGDHVLGILTTVPGGHASVHQHHASCSFLCRDHQSTVLGRSLQVPPCNIMESYVRINGTGMDSLFYSRKLNGMKMELHCPTLLSTYMDTFCHQTENWTNNCCFEAVHWSSRSSTILLYHRTLHINGPPKRNMVGWFKHGILLLLARLWKRPSCNTVQINQM